MEVNASQFRNALSLIDKTLSGSVMEVNDSQLLNALLPILISVLPCSKVTDCNPVDANAPCSIDTILLGISMAVNAGSPKNISFSIVAIFDDNVMDVNAVQF
jgi:hypothetical protein